MCSRACTARATSAPNPLPSHPVCLCCYRYLTLKYEEALPSILSSRGAGNSIIIAENLTDLSSPAVFADKAMKGLSAKQLGLLHDATGVAPKAGSSMMVGTQLPK